MPENTFQCVDKHENLEACKHCGSFDFKFRQTLSTSIVCAKCQKFHKSLEPSLTAASDVLKKLEFARRHGE